MEFAWVEERPFSVFSLGEQCFAGRFLGALPVASCAMLRTVLCSADCRSQSLSCVLRATSARRPTATL